MLELVESPSSRKIQGSYGKLQMGNNKTYYSKAFQGYRDEFLEETWIIMTSLVAIVVAYGAYKGYST